MKSMPICTRVARAGRLMDDLKISKAQSLVAISAKWFETYAILHEDIQPPTHENTNGITGFVTTSFGVRKKRTLPQTHSSPNAHAIVIK